MDTMMIEQDLRGAEEEADQSAWRDRLAQARLAAEANAELGTASSYVAAVQAIVALGAAPLAKYPTLRVALIDKLHEYHGCARLSQHRQELWEAVRFLMEECSAAHDQYVQACEDEEEASYVQLEEMYTDLADSA